MYNENSKIENKKILIIGMSKSGYNIAKLLADNNKIIITDKKEQDANKLQELKSLGVSFIMSDHQENLLDSSFDLLVRNPGVDPHNKVILKARELNIPITNEMEIAYHYLPKSVKIIGITGSNGKTTTTTMTYEILKQMGYPVVLGGNIGYPLSEIIFDVKEDSILVLEISDHQLYDFQDFKTDISVLTNLCPTHLDFHDNYENYKNVKHKIFNHHTKKDIAIINFGNEDSLNITKDINSTKKYFNGNNAYINRDAIYINNDFIIALKDIKVKGNHNYENIMAALLVCSFFKLDKDIIRDYLTNFKGVEHRLEYVDTINDITYYNDSKATNPTSTVIAVNSFKGNVHLILGGFERSQDFNELNEITDKIKCIYAVGATTDRCASWALEQGIKVVKSVTLKQAMLDISSNIVSGDVVLLSPASASWDQYNRFEDRGTEFKNLVKEIRNK